MGDSANLSGGDRPTVLERFATGEACDRKRLLRMAVEVGVAGRGVAAPGACFLGEGERAAAAPRGAGEEVPGVTTAAASSLAIRPSDRAPPILSGVLCLGEGAAEAGCCSVAAAAFLGDDMRGMFIVRSAMGTFAVGWWGGGLGDRWRCSISAAVALLEVSWRVSGVLHGKWTLFRYGGTHVLAASPYPAIWLMVMSHPISDRIYSTRSNAATGFGLTARHRRRHA